MHFVYKSDTVLDIKQLQILLLDSESKTDKKLLYSVTRQSKTITMEPSISNLRLDKMVIIMI